MTTTSEPWQIRVYESQKLVYTAEFSGPAELGRQRQGEAGPYWAAAEGDTTRIVIAPLKEQSVSRVHLRVEPLSGDKLKLSNLSKLAAQLADGDKLEPGTDREVLLPAVLQLGTRTIRFQAVTTEPSDIQSLSSATRAPGQDVPMASLPVALGLAGGPGMDAEALVRWLQATLEVLQSAAGSLDFFTRAARAVVDLVGLDSAGVLLLEQEEWKVKAAQAAPAVVLEPNWQPSRQVLGRVLREKRTCWRVPPASQLGGSLLGVTAVVAAPILDRRGEVIGALYGERRQQEADNPSHLITRLEAMLVEVLAGGIAAGLARLEQEQVAVRARVQLEQFFTRELYQELEARPELLQPRDTEVTILFADVRSFSRISERLGPTRTVEWISDVLGALSECVLAQQGVVVEYIGDELLAMWGAPVAVEDHAERACRAALAMLERLPELNERWESVLQEPIGVGIGINSGVAHVGNIGSTYKFKYQALGNTVNLASRVQGATKYLKAGVLLTRATRDQLGPTFAVRRVCQVRVVNIGEPVELYELTTVHGEDQEELRREYEQALERFEKASFRTAIRILGNILNEHPDDGPTLVLMSRALDCRWKDVTNFDPVWELPGK